MDENLREKSPVLAKDDFESLSLPNDSDRILGDELSLENLKCFLAKHPELIPEEALRERLVDDVAEDNNRVMVSGGSEHAEFFAAHPEYAFRVRAIMQSYAIANKLRLVEDRGASEAVREIRKRQEENRRRGFFRRVLCAVLNKDDDTAIIKYYDNLAADIAALEGLQLKLRKENAESAAKAAENVKAAEQKAESALQEARTHSAKLLEQASAQSAKMTSGALEMVKTLTRETGERITLERKESVTELAELKRRVKDAENELREKQQLLDRLNTNPNLLEAWKHEQGSRIEEEKADAEAIMAQAQMLIASPKFSGDNWAEAERKRLLVNMNSDFTVSRWLLDALKSFSVKYPNKIKVLAARVYSLVVPVEDQFNNGGPIFNKAVNFVHQVRAVCERVVIGFDITQEIKEKFEDWCITNGELDFEKIGLRPDPAGQTASQSKVVVAPAKGTDQLVSRLDASSFPEAKLAEFISFYQKTKLDLPPDFEDTMREIWNRNQADIEQAMKQNGFDDLLMIPGNIPLAELADKMKMEKGYWSNSYFNASGGFAGAVSQNVDKPRIILVYKTQNLQDRPKLKETLGIKGEAVKLDQTPTLEDYLIFQKKYFEETGKHLDQESAAWLATNSGARLVSSSWDPGSHRLSVAAPDPGARDDYLGVRLSRCFR